MVVGEEVIRKRRSWDPAWVEQQVSSDPPTHPAISTSSSSSSQASSSSSLASGHIHIIIISIIWRKILSCQIFSDKMGQSADANQLHQILPILFKKIQKNPNYHLKCATSYFNQHIHHYQSAYYNTNCNDTVDTTEGNQNDPFGVNCINGQ